MNDAEREASVAIASRLLAMAEQDARQYCRAVPEAEAYFFWQPVRGGGQLLVHRDGSVLFGASVLTFEQMLAAFLAGRRTDPRAWD